MPELPEVEVLTRSLAPLVKGKVVRAVQLLRPKVIAPSVPRDFTLALQGARFTGLTRRGKYLLFELRGPNGRRPFSLLGHLGMTGRMYLAPAGVALPKHAAVVLGLGRFNFIYEDTRYFGRLTLDTSAINQLGPEPLDAAFTPAYLAAQLARSAQPIKVKLLDQSLVAGIGNIYASEALFRARISPRRAARKLKPEEIRRLWRCIRQVLREAIARGSTIPLDFSGATSKDRLFYFGQTETASEYYQERLLVYDRAGAPCSRCGELLKRIIQAARSTYFCPACQPL